MPTTLSVETRLTEGLRNLGCSVKSFVAIARELGVQISDARFSQAVNDIRPLDHATGRKLLAVLDRMRELQSAIFSAVDSRGNSIGLIQPDWMKIENIVNALSIRLVAQVASELSINEASELQEAANQAIQKISSSKGNSNG